MSETNPQSRGENLPTPLSSFIGREREITEVKNLLETKRLVTLTGPGGSGKTRLALQVANGLKDEYEDGIWLSELGSLSDGALVVQTIASSLNLREQPNRTLIDTLSDYLLNRHALLVIDNCEHLIQACAQFADAILPRCPNLHILTTSREMLGIAGETVWVIPPLSLPEAQPWKNPESVQRALHVYRQSEAVQLFVDRASAMAQDFSLSTENGAWVSEICRRLDGMPLAIELAAARVRALSVQQITERLDDRFHLLVDGSRTSAPRQHTLFAAIDWSYELLPAPEQKVLQRLSLFASGATLNAAESVCAGNGVAKKDVLEIISQLVNKSLVTVSKDSKDVSRYSLLETIRQYAGEKAENSVDFAESKDRFIKYFCSWAIEAGQKINTTGKKLWLERFEAEDDNLRAAMEWSQTSKSNVDLGLRLASDLVGFWLAHDHYSEGRKQLEAILEKTKDTDLLELRAHVVYETANMAFTQTDYPAVHTLLEESLSIYQSLGPEGRLGQAKSLLLLGDMWRQLGEYATAFPLFVEGLRLMQELDDKGGIVVALWQLGYYAVSTGDYVQAEKYLTEALHIAQQNNDKGNSTIVLSALAETALRQNHLDQAAKFEEESLKLRREIGEKWGIAVSLANFGWIALRRKDFVKAEEYLLESLSLRHEIEDRGGMAWCLEKLAKINVLYGQKKTHGDSSIFFRRAVRLFGAAFALRAPFGSAIDQADQEDYDQSLDILKKSLGQERFSNLWGEGAAMAFEKLLDEAGLESNNRKKQRNQEPLAGLTTREREVATLISQGKSNREIAEAMTVRVKTVETYVTRILHKLGFGSRVQIATWALEKGLNKKDL
jgi:predicted ATPase/DNA-binding CsgD family transcriptional regulator